MEADDDVTATPDALAVEYDQLDWGDLILGTKRQLQALGLAVDLAFPGEPGAPARLEVKDPRGFEATIESAAWRLEGCFFARISFPNWPDRRAARRWPARSPAPLGLTKHEAVCWDEFTGTAEALAAAGLLRIDQLPGMPGMRKGRVRIFPDGTLPSAPLTVAHSAANLPGARCIARAGRSAYRVTVRVAAEEEHFRRDFELRADEAWRQEVRAMARPQRLTDYVQGLIEARVARVRGVEAMACMGVLHRRKLPAGWRVIAGRAP